MADDTLQYGTADTISTDHLTQLNGSPVTQTPTSPKAQRVKVGYGDDGSLRDVSPLFPLPVAPGQSADIPLVINSLAPTTAVDCLGYRWVSVQMTAGYVGMTSLTVQVSNDGTTWFSMVLTPTSSGTTGITSSIGIAAGLFHGPISGRYIRFNPAGTYSSGSCTLLVQLSTIPLVMNSQGVSANISSVSSAIFPAVGLSTFVIGTAAGNAFQTRQTGSADQATTTFMALVSGQMMYITELHWSVWGAGSTDRQLVLVSNGSPLGQQDIYMNANKSDSRVFRNPWKPASATGIALNYSVTSVGAAAGNWFVVAHGYYAAS